ncbi:MAG: tetratricopeptide repeat protein [Candidatus Zixiibacteriota bacterium]
MLKKVIFFLMLVVYFSGCSHNLLIEGKKFADEGHFNKAIDKLHKKIEKNPDNEDAWRELGIAYYKKGDYVKAENNLIYSNSILPQAKTYLYLGLIYEHQKNYQQAVDAYRASLNLEPKGKVKKHLLARLDGIVVMRIKQDIKKQMATEDEIDYADIPENSIAVTNFDGSMLNEDYRPIARGLAEFTSIDLAKVKSLVVLERLKLNMLLEELKLSTTIYADQSVAPRIGKLLGTKRLVTGSLYSISEDKLNLNGMIVDIIDTSINQTESQENQIKKFFEIQKNFVFQILDEIGVQPTQEERNAIKEIPTESFLAFLEYCKGLEYQSQGMYQEAAQQFEKAVSIDQNFSEASQQAVTSTNIQNVVEANVTTDQFEIAIVTEITQGTGSSVATTPVANVANIMISTQIPDHTSTGGNDPVVTDPPKPTVTVTVQGDLDAQ